jgi:hypothetical protein
MPSEWGATDINAAAAREQCSVNELEFRGLANAIEYLSAHVPQAVGDMPWHIGTDSTAIAACLKAREHEMNGCTAQVRTCWSNSREKDGKYSHTARTARFGAIYAQKSAEYRVSWHACVRGVSELNTRCMYYESVIQVSTHSNVLNRRTPVNVPKHEEGYAGTHYGAWEQRGRKRRLVRSRACVVVRA